jgi:hypothetical protein
VHELAELKKKGDGLRAVMMDGEVWAEVSTGSW